MSITTEQSLHIAVQHCSAGRVAEAEAIYRQVIARQPRHDGALYLLALLLGERGRPAEAAELMARAVKVLPAMAEYHGALGEFLRQAGRIEEAAASLRRAIELAPQSPEIRNSFASALRDQGLTNQAVAAYRDAIRLKPDFAEAYSNLGNALRGEGRLEESIAAHREAVRLKPSLPAAHGNLAIALTEAGQFADAESSCRKAIELDPNRVESHNNLGNALRRAGRLEDAFSAYNIALQCGPDSPQVWTNLGSAFKEKGLPDPAVNAHRKAIELQPGYVDAHINLGAALADRGQIDEALAEFKHASELRPDSSSPWRNWLYTMHFHPAFDARRIRLEHEKWAHRFADPLTAGAPAHANDRSPDRRLRIGYISPDFCNHPVGRFLQPLFAHHDRTGFEILCYSAVAREDTLTARLRGHSDQWTSTGGMSDARLAERIRRDQIDILVDLSMHMAGSRLMVFARKPAPIQVTWLAYAGTTGMRAMDYRVSDPHLDPVLECDADYVEQTVRLPVSYWCYPAPEDSPPVNSLPAITGKTITFGCFNSFCKVSDAALLLWARLLEQFPVSRLILHANPGSHREQVRGLFASAGIRPERLDFVGFQPMNAYLRQHHDIDIALDPFPYGGGTTTCDTLWMGIPVVTLRGATAVGRAGASLLSNLGLSELIADTPDQYVSIAVELARDLPRLSALRGRLRQRMLASPLMDGKRFAADMEAAFRWMWERWCNL